MSIASHVVCQLSFDGPDGSTEFVDQTRKRWTTASGNPRITTARSKFGGALALDGNSWLISPPHPDFLFGLGDFTLEFWLWVNAHSNWTAILSLNGGYYGGGLYIRLSNARALNAMFDANWSVSILDPEPFPLNQWVHVALSRENGVARLFKNGLKVGEVTNSSNLNRFDGQRIGQDGQDVGKLNGYIDDLRVIKDVALYVGDFDVPSAPHPDLPSRDGGPTVLVRPKSVWADAIEEISTRTMRAPTSMRDMEFSGRGRIAGTVKVKGTPNVPTKRRVRLLRDRDFLLVRETWSDPVTGAYAFHEIDERYTYTVIADDYEGNFRAVLADRVVPEVMQ